MKQGLWQRRRDDAPIGCNTHTFNRLLAVHLISKGNLRGTDWLTNWPGKEVSISDQFHHRLIDRLSTSCDVNTPANLQLTANNETDGAAHVTGRLLKDTAHLSTAAGQDKRKCGALRTVDRANDVVFGCPLDER